MAGWFDYIAKKQNPILNSFLSLSYESELLVDNVNVLGTANCSCDVIYNNESITLEEYEEYLEFSKKNKKMIRVKNKNI